MINAFKKDGGYKDKEGRSYSAKIIGERSDLEDGWFLTLEEAMAEAVSSKESNYEQELRNNIKELGGVPAGRSSIKTLEKQLEELEGGDDDDNE